MRVVLVGKLPDASVVEKIRSLQINLTNHVETIDRVIDLVVSDTSSQKIDKIVILPQALGSTDSAVDDLLELQKSLEVLSEETELVIYTTDKEMYTRITEQEVISVKYASVYYGTKIGFRDVVTRMKEEKTPYKFSVSHMISFETRTDLPVKEETPLRTVDRSESKVVAVCSLFGGCGASFITENVAFMLGQSGKSVSVVELPTNEPRLFRMLEVKPGLVSASRRIKEFSAVGKDSMIKEGPVYWFPLESNHTPFEDSRVNIELIRQTRVAPITFVDCGDKWDSLSVREIFDLVDEIWVVVAPVVNKTKLELKRFQDICSTWKDKVYYVANKFDDYTKGELNDGGMFQGSEEIIGLIWNFNSSLISKSEWTGTILSKLPEANKSVTIAFGELLQRL